MASVWALRRPFPRAAAFLLPVIGTLLAASAVTITVILHEREDVQRRRQVAVVELRGAVDQLQAVAWSGRPDLRSMRRAEHDALVRLRALGLVSLAPSLRANFAALNSIVGGNLISDERARTYVTVAGGLSRAADAAANSADRADAGAIFGSATSIGLLVGVFWLLNVRLGLAHRRAQADRLRVLTSTVAGADAERRRIAADLHDGPIQQLTATAFTLDLLINRIRSGRLDSVDAGLRDVRVALASQMGSLRRLMAELRPPVLDEGGVAAAIASRAAEVLPERANCTVRDGTSAVRFLPELETAVYRIAGEALANVAKHAGAAHVDVVLDRRGEELTVAVIDDGVGFEARRLDAPSCHLGLTSMRERVESLGGRLRVHSACGIGTRVEATLPWRTRSNEDERAVA